MARRGPRPGAAVTVAVGGGDLPTMPEHLSDDAKAVWREIIAVIPAGILLRVDATILAAFATYSVQWRLYKAALPLHPICSPEHRRLLQNMNDAHVRLERCIAELAMSPNARARLRLESTAPVADELDAFLKKGKP